MKDYVSRQDAFAACHAIISTRDNGLGTVGLTHQDIADLPAADVVEVVRCKDCKYALDIDPPFISCQRLNGLSWCMPDSFCSGGERRKK